MNDLLAGFSRLSDEDDNLSKGFNLLPDKPVEDLSQVGSTREQDQTNVTQAQGLADGFSRTTDPVIPQSKLNPLSEGLPEKGSGAYDYLYGSLVEVPRDLVWGAVSWPVAQLIRHSAVAGQKIQQQLGIVPKMTPEEQSIMGENVANYIQTMGGLAVPTTETGKASLELAGKVIEPINKFAHWAAQGINPEKHPNLHNVIATGVEFGVFATIPKVGKGLNKIAKDRSAMLKMKGKAKQEAAIKIMEDQAKLLKETETAIAKGEMKELIAERQQKNQQLIAGAEGISAIDIPRIESKIPTKSEISQRTKGFEPGEVMRPRKAIETQLKEGVNLVEKVPGKLSVYQIITEPLKGEAGAIRLPFSQKEFKQKIKPEIRESIRKIGKAAEEAGLEFNDFLKTRGMDSKQIREMNKLHKLAKEEQPLRSALETQVKAPKEFDPFTRDPKDPKVNIGKENNPKIDLGLSDVKTMAKIPIMKKGGLIQGLRTPEIFFSNHPTLRPLMNWKRSIDKIIVKEKEILTKSFRNIEQTYKNKKLRKDTGAWYMAKTKFGKEAMETMGIKVKENPAYESMMPEIQLIFKDLLTRINEARIKIGKKPIKEMEDFLAFFAEESFMRDVKDFLHGEGNKQSLSLITDDLTVINSRHTRSVLDQATFNHIQRKGLREGVKLELDPVIILKRYANEALPAIHYSPLNAYIKEIMTKDLTMPNKQIINFKELNPGLSAELGSWSNNLIGKSNLPLPPFLEKQINKLSRNLTNATLVGNIRTAGIQPTALLTTFTELPIETGKATISYLKDIPKDFESKSIPTHKSDVLINPSVDVAFGGMTDSLGGTKTQKIGAITGNTMSWAMRQADYVARDITFRAKMIELNKAVKSKKITEAEAIRQADSMVIRTQSSGARGEVSPIQRNAIGKMLTLWQTFTIGHINWLAREVVGIKNPELKPRQARNRTFRYLLGLTALGYIFEDGFGIQAPGPAIPQAIIRDIKQQEKDIKAGKQQGLDFFKTAITAGREIAELVPFGATIKFGSSPLGPVADFLGQLSDVAAGTSFFEKDVLVKARKGNVKSIIKLLELTGKLKGVPGTAQIAKTARGLLRDENILRALIGRIPGESGAPIRGQKSTGISSGKRRKRKARSKRRKKR